MHISRRYVKKHGIPDPADEVTGYENMDEVCKDLEEVVDVLWFSGTRMFFSSSSFFSRYHPYLHLLQLHLHIQ